MASIDDHIADFLKAPSFAVAGASEDTSKYGHQCFAALLRGGYKVYPINPKTVSVLGHQCYASVSALPHAVESVSIVTPPAVTEQVINDCIASGVKAVWMQPGAESHAAIARAETAGIQVISGGACLLVALSYRR